MKILFLSLGEFTNLNSGSVHIDLVRKLAKENDVYLVCKSERNKNGQVGLFEECGVHVLRVKTGAIKTNNYIIKGISTITVESKFKRAIKRYFKEIHFELILYTTPPITFVRPILYIKRKDKAKTYLMLKDIFPQNAVDIGMLSKAGLKGVIYRYFRRKEKKLYAISDRIGCMSPANVEYLLKHNPEISPEKVEICPNSIEVRDMSLTADEKISIRAKYGLPIDKKIFVYGGNLGKPQGVPFIIECLKSQLDNQKAFFLIVGSGTEYGKLEEFFTQSKPTNMKLMRSLPKDEYDRMIAACDVGMIFLDHRFTIPNFPSRLLGYMQAKLPVLACTDPNTDIGKIIVDGGFGWWCESNDLQAFKNIVKKIMTLDLDLLGQNGFEYLDCKYSVCDTYKTIIDLVLS